MPPHCDAMDGPVVSAAKAAIETRDADRMPPFVPKAAEDEVRAAFERAMRESGLVALLTDAIEAMLGLEVWSLRLCEAATSTVHGGHEPVPVARASG